MTIKRRNAVIFSFSTPTLLWPTVTDLEWSRGNREGALRANEVLGHLRRDTRHVPIVGHLVKSMIDSGTYGAIEVGFWHRMAVELSRPVRGESNR